MDDMEMADMQMDDAEIGSDKQTSDNSTFERHQMQDEAETNTQRVLIDLPPEPCGHCWMHSQPASGTATLVGVDSAKPSADTYAPLANSVTILPNVFTVPIAPLEHGPPGNALPLHVLINVFRI